MFLLQTYHFNVFMSFMCFDFSDWDADDLLYSDDDAKPSRKPSKQPHSPGGLFLTCSDRDNIYKIMY